MTASNKPTHLYDYFKLKASYTPIKVPIMPLNAVEWMAFARPTVGSLDRNFNLTPFWIDIYEDNHPNIMLICGRQTFKTTFCSDMLANSVTSKPRTEACYVADNEPHLSAFSRQRFRIETFMQNIRLRPFLRHDRANIGEISLINDSTVYLVTDEGQYQKVEGKSLQLLMFDETQYQDVQFLQKAMYALFQTKGRLYLLGIGGEAGSDYHKLWARTDQREWIYHDKYWYDKIQRDARGNITNDEDKLRTILSGHWVPQKPENTQFRGYHVPQTLFPTIPRTIADAQQYNINPEFSIEYQRRYSPKSTYLSHCLGEFFKAERRPITPEMVQNLYVHNLSLLRPDEVKFLKEIFGNEIRVLGGVDFGSGPSASKTVASIIIHWRKSNRYQLCWIDPRPQEHQLDQARYLAELFAAYGIDYSVGDLGYGAIQVKVMQDGGRDSKDRKFKGLGRKRFTGCRTIGDETKPEMRYTQETDEHGTELGRLQIDKTTTIQAFIDLIGTYVSHPTRPTEEKLKVPQFMIPYKNDYEVDFLMNDFCSITRKDLDEQQEIRVEDPRQRARKEFNHPPDTVMSIIYCLVAAWNYEPGRFRITPVKKK